MKKAQRYWWGADIMIVVGVSGYACLTVPQGPNVITNWSWLPLSEWSVGFDRMVGHEKETGAPFVLEWQSYGPLRKMVISHPDQRLLRNYPSSGS